MTRQGNQIHYQANPHCPIYSELLAIVRKTLSLDEPLCNALAPFAEHITWAFIYGSIAKGEAHSSSDIDLMLIGESLNYSEVMEQLIPLEEQLSRPINPTLYTPEDWLGKWNAGNSFVAGHAAGQDQFDWGQPPGTHEWIARQTWKIGQEKLELLVPSNNLKSLSECSVSNVGNSGDPTKTLVLAS
jgi:predicted nucleotidyltransferase